MLQNQATLLVAFQHPTPLLATINFREAPLFKSVEESAKKAFLERRLWHLTTFNNAE